LAIWPILILNLTSEPIAITSSWKGNANPSEHLATPIQRNTGTPGFASMPRRDSTSRFSCRVVLYRHLQYKAVVLHQASLHVEVGG